MWTRLLLVLFTAFGTDGVALCRKLARLLYVFNIIITHQKKFVMGNLLYIIAVILIIGWLLGMFAFHAGSFIHALLVIAVILFLIKLLGGRSSI